MLSSIINFLFFKNIINNNNDSIQTTIGKIILKIIIFSIVRML